MVRTESVLVTTGSGVVAIHRVIQADAERSSGMKGLLQVLPPVGTPLKDHSLSRPGPYRFANPMLLIAVIFRHNPAIENLTRNEINVGTQPPHIGRIRCEEPFR